MAGLGTERTPADGGPIRHRPVLLQEVMRYLAPSAGKVYIDGTFGAGGYSAEILKSGAQVIAIDRDPDAIAAGAALAKRYEGRLILVEGRFSDLDHVSEVPVDGVVLDIGVSSMQFDQAERGFSFRHDGPLDMRMGQDGRSAANLVNSLDETTLAKLIYVYGEDRKSRAIARALVRERDRSPIETTGRLARIVADAIGRPTDKIHPATRTFQALRIAVNCELDELADALGAAERMLDVGGRLIVVSFHSLEDRIVKRFLQDRSRTHAGGSRHRPEAVVPDPTFSLMSRKAVEPGRDEIAANPRARSAKLRAAQRTDAPARALDKRLLGVPAFSEGDLS